jgi:hypothetical protein
MILAADVSNVYGDITNLASFIESDGIIGSIGFRLAIPVEVTNLPEEVNDMLSILGK